ncbi:MAG: uroporphyrinogen decarboxylase family protein [Terriglobia bacterium]|jgi:uroporphyrinogen-III decarboxylase
MTMTHKERLLTALRRGKPDRLPVTTHHLMQYFLDRYLGSATSQVFFEQFDLDAITWPVCHKPNVSLGDFSDPHQGEPGFLEARRVWSDRWQTCAEDVSTEGCQATRYRFVTPRGTLAMVTQSNDQTTWVVEPPVKEKRDIDLIGDYATQPLCDVDAVNRVAEEYGERGLVRSHVACFDVFGQPGTWQDACCLYGTEKLILATFDDPGWVHEFLRILFGRKRTYIQSMAGARLDLVELGGGSASSTVISPKVFDEFVAPYDSELIALAHAAGQRIVYHTCGGMMPILERIAAMRPDAMETFTPPGMGGDADLAEAKKRIGEKVCMIGGFDQFHYLSGCTPEETRQAVRRCFEGAGEGGGYILCPSDHFFDADLKLIEAFADEAHRCVYTA